MKTKNTIKRVVLTLTAAVAVMGMVPDTMAQRGKKSDRGDQRSSGASNYSKSRTSSSNYSKSRGSSSKYSTSRNSSSKYGKSRFQRPQKSRMSSRPIRSCYVYKHNRRYKQVTFLNRRVSPYGRVLASWKSTRLTRG